jgi:hypothetical protein
MPSPVYQNMVNLIVNLSIRRHPNKFMNVTLWEHGKFVSQIFGRGKVYYSVPIIITSFMKLSFSIVGLKMSSLPTLTLKSPIRMFIWYLGNISNTRSASYYK